MARPLLFAAPEELQAKIDQFFEDCKNNDEHPIVEGLALALKTNPQTLINYQDRPEFADIIENAKIRIANHVMGRAMAGKINPTIAIWVSKNHYGYVDKQQTEHSGSLVQRIERHVIDSPKNPDAS